MASAARSGSANPEAPPTEAKTDKHTRVTTEAVLALAQKLHDQYVSEGQDTRKRLINEGRSRHDQLVGEATQRKEDLLSTGQAKYDEFVSTGEAKQVALIAAAHVQVAEATAEHERLITEAREHSNGMVAQAQQKRAEVLDGLGDERRFLQKEIDELRISKRDLRARQISYLRGQLSELEQTDQSGS